jgi:ribosomal protein S4
MGSDLNSNFDKKNSVNREDSKDYIVSTLGKMSEDYRVMLDGGNAYTLKYASHILNIATDSSHYRYSSYPVPFVGMILHGYVSYAGAPLNYAGNAKYDALRSIESGAAPYYILAYEESNIKKLKEDDAFVAAPKWLDRDKNTLTGKVIAMPTKADIDFDIAEHLIVELYSK